LASYKGVIDRLDKVRWDRVEAIGTILAVLLAGIAIYYAYEASRNANDIDQQLLNIQKRQFAFPTSIISDTTNAKVYGEYWDYTANGSLSSSVDAVGDATIHFMVFTPDKGYIHLEAGNLTPIQLDYSALPPPYNMSSISYRFIGAKDQTISSQTDTVDVNCSLQVNFNITANYLDSIDGVPIAKISSVNGVPIGQIKSYKGVPLAPQVNQSLPIKNRDVLIYIGTVNFSGEFVDKSSYPEETMPIAIPVNLYVSVKWYYR
jgi:hypothetical protein